MKTKEKKKDGDLEPLKDETLKYNPPKGKTTEELKKEGEEICQASGEAMIEEPLSSLEEEKEEGPNVLKNDTPDQKDLEVDDKIENVNDEAKENLKTDTGHQDGEKEGIDQSEASVASMKSKEWTNYAETTNGTKNMNCSERNAVSKECRGMKN